MIKFTPQAIAHLNTSLEASESVRVAVVGGGCAGMSYTMDIVSEGDEEDLILELEDTTIYVDPHSARILSNTTIDYVVSLQKRGFTFLNPDANMTCGCGSSFS
jgi:iron-sulfur cluster assembly accessory protein